MWIFLITILHLCASNWEWLSLGWRLVLLALIDFGGLSKRALVFSREISNAIKSILILAMTGLYLHAYVILIFFMLLAHVTPIELSNWISISNTHHRMCKGQLTTICIAQSIWLMFTPKSGAPICNILIPRWHVGHSKRHIISQEFIESRWRVNLLLRDLLIDWLVLLDLEWLCKGFLC